MSEKNQISSLEEEYLFALVNLSDADDARSESEVQHIRERQLSVLSSLLGKAKKSKCIREILVIERHSVNWEYDRLEKSQAIDAKIKAPKLTSLDNVLVQIRNCIKDANLILQNPKEYAVGIQEAYGQHRTILAPPAGDTVRKFVVTQAQRIGRLNNGGRSDQEMLFFTARQEALKTLGFVYTQLQCKALGLDAKNAKALSSASP